MSKYSDAMLSYRNVTSSAEITEEWIASLPGNFRPPWWHPIRRWAWNRGQLAADGKSLLVGIKPPEKRR